MDATIEGISGAWPLTPGGRRERAPRPSILALGAFLLAAAAGPLEAQGPPADCPPGGTQLTWEDFGLPFLAEHCNGCHGDWTSYAGAYADRRLILDLTWTGRMPPSGSVAPSLKDQLAEWVACGAPRASSATPYRRGDANADGKTDISDAVAVLAYLFLGAAEPPCLDATDFDGIGAVDLTDVIYLLAYLFRAGSPPPGRAGGTSAAPAPGRRRGRCTPPA